MRLLAYYMFVNLKEALDKLNRFELQNVLCRFGVDGGLLNAVRVLYNGVNRKFTTNGMFSKQFSTKQGVRQYVKFKQSLA